MNSVEASRSPIMHCKQCKGVRTETDFIDQYGIVRMQCGHCRARARENEKKLHDHAEKRKREMIPSRCMDCPETKMERLEFDHVDEKECTISRCRSKPAIDREVAKCVLRCKECHDKRTSAQDEERLAKLVLSTNPDTVQKRHKKREKYAYICQTKKERGGCERCRTSYDESNPRFFHYDHINPFMKRFPISDYMSRSLEAIKEEIAKCRLLCAYCHREATAEQRSQGLVTCGPNNFLCEERKEAIKREREEKKRQWHERNKEIKQLHAKGMSSAEIADYFDMAVRTVNTHVSSVVRDEPSTPPMVASKRVRDGTFVDPVMEMLRKQEQELMAGRVKRAQERDQILLDRRNRVLSLFRDGKSVDEIAAQVEVSKWTVYGDLHKLGIIRKRKPAPVPASASALALANS